MRTYHNLDGGPLETWMARAEAAFTEAGRVVDLITDDEAMEEEQEQGHTHDWCHAAAQEG